MHNPARRGLSVALVAFSLVIPNSIASNPKDESAKPKAGLGFSYAEAIEVCRPDGEEAYLSRLRCENGKRPKFKRVGSGGSRNPAETKDANSKALDQMMSRKPLKAGEIDYHMIDIYEVKCSKQTIEIYMDMYHCGQPISQEAPPGFSIDKSGKKRAKD